MEFETGDRVQIKPELIKDPKSPLLGRIYDIRLSEQGQGYDIAADTRITRNVPPKKLVRYSGSSEFWELDDYLMGFKTPVMGFKNPRPSRGLMTLKKSQWIIVEPELQRANIYMKHWARQPAFATLESIMDGSEEEQAIEMQDRIDAELEEAGEKGFALATELGMYLLEFKNNTEHRMLTWLRPEDLVVTWMDDPGHIIIEVVGVVAPSQENYKIEMMARKRRPKREREEAAASSSSSSSSSSSAPGRRRVLPDDRDDPSSSVSLALRWMKI